MIESLKKHLPLISILILVSSILKNTIYYDFFSIKINQYVTLTEFPLLFIEDLDTYLIYILSFLLYFPFIYIRIWAREKFGEKHMTFTLTKRLSIVVIPLCIGAIAKSIFINKDLMILQNEVIIFAAFFILYLDKSLDYSLKYFSVVSSILIIFISICNAYEKIEKVEKGKTNFHVQFFYEAQQFVTNKNYVF